MYRSMTPRDTGAHGAWVQNVALPQMSYETLGISAASSDDGEKNAGLVGRATPGTRHCCVCFRASAGLGFIGRQHSQPTSYTYLHGRRRYTLQHNFPQPHSASQSHPQSPGGHHQCVKVCLGTPLLLIQACN